MVRCGWCEGSELYKKYHDEEWGAPNHDDRRHFEFLVLEAAQAGLSWLTILKKRENYRSAYDNFDFEKVALYGDEKTAVLLSDPGIIRNRRKIKSSINNAKRFIEIRREFGSFDSYIWSFTGGTQIVNSIKSLSELPASSPLSGRISKDLKARGFSFMGTVIVYSFLQAVGIIDDHVNDCFRKTPIKYSDAPGF